MSTQIEQTLSDEAGRRSEASEKPDLVLHIGPGKTGSSAIQAWLGRVSHSLKRSGVLYPAVAEDEREDFAGNAQKLAAWLSRPRSTAEDRFPEVIESMLQDYISQAEEAGCHTVLLSSEFFPTADRANLEFFRSEAEKYFKLRIVGYLRDPYWWLWSSWGQAVKRAAMCEDFAAYALNNAKVLGETLKGLISIFDDVRFLVYRETGLIESFARALDLPARLVDAKAETTVNRSMTWDELDILLSVNRTFRHAELSRMISDQMIAARPDAVAYRDFDPELAAVVRGANEGIFAEIQSLIVNPDVPIIDNSNVRSEAKHRVAQVDRETFEVVLSAIRSWFDRSTPYLQLQQMAKQVAPEEEYAGLLPEGFDSIEYLLLNPDVAAAGVDPIGHYLTYGQKEGRAYRRPIAQRWSSI